MTVSINGLGQKLLMYYSKQRSHLFGKSNKGIASSQWIMHLRLHEAIHVNGHSPTGSLFKQYQIESQREACNSP